MTMFLRHLSSARTPLFAARLVSGALSIGASTACSTPDDTVTVPPGGPDRTTFGPVVTVLMKRCGSLDCHGSPYRNMRLYGYTGLRLDPSNLPDSPAETTAAEVDADYDAVVSLEPEILRRVVADKGQNADRLTLLRKGRGEEQHKGGRRIVPGDAADVCMLSWLASAMDTDACSRAGGR